MRTTGDTRQRIVTAATELFRRQGYAATGMKQIVAEAGAPYGSAYHFFPGGKAQLGEEVIRTSGAAYLELIGSLFADPGADPAAATAAAFTGAAETLRELDFADPCPIATVALEVASTHEGLRRATADVFASWIEALASRYAGAGIGADTARDTAGSVIALLEGAFMLARAAHDTAPVRTAARAAAAVVRDALESG
ncbi:MULTISPECIES: TetR/AcrR family transcriptional regulator [unclassified Streptomyces]|jgi:AcrR family transcriptional regulator|uniref:TetR/AcrR family transcriptional regulator n=1 Tax=unclassified Streptomyces TaxID=2593676 RepID=UPI00081BA4D9|nr:MULTISPECIES: TetR/AcrR family transcriptional regulator [unclassified Streptomyces]MYQ89696.1 TetR family transcriptional regulator [Streptomyces sp. SID4936]SCE59268.1 transcriptional regulator, TetR family [Streptomyces sp. DvalAA-43]